MLHLRILLDEILFPPPHLPPPKKIRKKERKDFWDLGSLLSGISIQSGDNLVFLSIPENKNKTHECFKGQQPENHSKKTSVLFGRKGDSLGVPAPCRWTWIWMSWVGEPGPAGRRRLEQIANHSPQPQSCHWASGCCDDVDVGN